jgi:HK97 family phage major capsid protein
MKLKVAEYSGAGDEGKSYIVTPMTKAKLQEWLTYPFMTSTQVPTNLTYGTGSSLTEMYFGNWQEFIMCMWGGIQLAKSTETSDAFQKNQTWIRIIQDVDMGIRHAESFCICSDINKVNQ